MDNLPMYSKNAVAAGLVDCTSHKLDAMHTIRHFIHTGSAGKDQVMGSASRRVMVSARELAGPESGPSWDRSLEIKVTARAYADMPTDTSVQVTEHPSGLMDAAAAPGTVSSSAAPSQTVFTLQTAKDKAAIRSSLIPQKMLSQHLQRHGVFNCRYNPRLVEVSTITTSCSQDAVKAMESSLSKTSLIMDIDEYSELIQHEAEPRVRQTRLQKHHQG